MGVSKIPLLIYIDYRVECKHTSMCPASADKAVVSNRLFDCTARMR